MAVVTAEVVVIGASCIDIKGKPLEVMRPGTSNPGEIKISVGGVARNIAENLARLGLTTTLLTAVGPDVFGQTILVRTSATGVDITRSLTVEGMPSASYLALLGDNGDMVVSIDDMGAIAALTPTFVYRQRDLFRSARLVVMDANVPERTMRAVFAMAHRYKAPVCVNPVSVALAHRVKPYLSRCSIITPNAAEAEALTGQPVTNVWEAALAAHRILAMGVSLAIITRGQEGVYYASRQSSGHIPAVRCDVADSTGASDALTAAVVYGLANDFSVDEAVRLGVSAAALTLLSTETVNPDMSLEYLYDMLRS
jgi:pseudouridine kinase